jgi:phage terminase large subunit GpA-like protein
MEFSPVIVFIDSGDGNVTDVVYQFCENMTGFYPIKGERWIKTKKGEQSDIPEYRSQKKYRMNADMPGNLILYTINTVWYKNHIYRNLSIPRKDAGTQRPGFCDFPINRSDKYFRMLTAAEKKIDGTFDSGARRDEALDCRVYAMCAADVWLQARLDDYRAKKKNDGLTAAQLQKISTRTILDYLAARTGNLTGQNQ